MINGTIARTAASVRHRLNCGCAPLDKQRLCECWRNKLMKEKNDLFLRINSNNNAICRSVFIRKFSESNVTKWCMKALCDLLLLAFYNFLLHVLCILRKPLRPQHCLWLVFIRQHRLYPSPPRDSMQHFRIRAFSFLLFTSNSDIWDYARTECYWLLNRWESKTILNYPSFHPLVHCSCFSSSS